MGYTTDPPPLSVISSSLLQTFKSIRGGTRNVFNRLYYTLWDHLYHQAKIDSMALAYALKQAAMASPAPFRLTTFDLLTLGRAYYLSCAGKRAIDGRYIVWSEQQRRSIKHMADHGWFSRSSFDPANPYAYRHYNVVNTFLSMKPPAISYYRSLLDEANKIAQKDAMNVITLMK